MADQQLLAEDLSGDDFDEKEEFLAMGRYVLARRARRSRLCIAA
jgi:hypothetical protein